VSETTLAITVPAATAVIVAVLAALTAYMAAKREQRRALYSEAIKVAVSWEEMLFRVRRRCDGQEQELIERFHTLQDELTYHRAWVGTDSRYMKRSYDALTVAVKTATAEPIKQAWADRVRPVPGNALGSDTFPNVEEQLERFLTDVRSHLSPLAWRKLAVIKRNWKVANAR
jgi:hypothetical protein